MTTDYQSRDAAPGLGPTREVEYRQVMLGQEQYLPGSFVIDGSKARDPLNTVDARELRPGLLLGRIAASKKFGASIIGVTSQAYSDDGVELVVSAATAKEIVRRIGATGQFKITGPATAGGQVVTKTVTYSAVDTDTGKITVTDLDADFIAGSFVQPNDGSETPVTIFLGRPVGYPVKAVDVDDNDRDLELGRYVIGGLVDSSQILNWPSDVALQKWVVDHLNAVGNFVFDHQHGL